MVFVCVVVLLLFVLAIHSFSFIPAVSVVVLRYNKQ